MEFSPIEKEYKIIFDRVTTSISVALCLKPLLLFYGIHIRYSHAMSNMSMHKNVKTYLHPIFNPIALILAKTLLSLGHSVCNWIKQGQTMIFSALPRINNMSWIARWLITMVPLQAKTCTITSRLYSFLNLWLDSTEARSLAHHTQPH